MTSRLHELKTEQRLDRDERCTCLARVSRNFHRASELTNLIAEPYPFPADSSCPRNAPYE